MSGKHTITVSGCSWIQFLAPGQRVLIGNRPAVVKRITATTLTVAWRDAWYWRTLDAIAAALWRMFRSRPTTGGPK